MTPAPLSRRTVLQGGGAALASMSVLRIAGPTSAFRTPVTGEVIPWLDQLAPNPVPEILVQQLDWAQVDAETWLTPTDQFFVVKHFNLPELNDADWRLEIGGLVDKPMTLTLDDLKARERQEVTFTLECSGNTGLPFLNGGIGNATWTGTPLAALLDEAGVQEPGIEVVFWGADAGEQTWREMKITEHFARSMSLADAMSPDNLLV
jgi:DMSO/TMAO reductase YedYZ molybdopterin-dependent catalytic subunit